MTQMVYGNNTTSNYQYDVKGRLEYIQTVTDTGGTPTTILDAKYTFSAQDSIKRVENTGDVFQTDYQYAYDGINRLVTATGSYVETDDGTGTAQTTPLEYKRGYVYTQNGNLDQKHFYNTTTDTISETWDYTYVNHQARVIDSTVDGTRFQMSYDAVGNMIHQNDLKNGKEKQIAFNSYNRIREVVDPNVGAGQVIGQYWYDDRGFRIRKKAKHDKGGDFKDVEVIYPSMYFGMEYIQEDDALNSVANIYHNGLRIAAMAQNGAKVWYMTDQVDSVKFVVDGNADVVTRTEYMPYGETFVQKGDEDHAPKYNSQELDRETNYYFYNARYYDPEIARFTSADTVIPDGTQGWNRYMYVLGNPIKYADPSGHEPGGSALLTKEVKEATEEIVNRVLKFHEGTCPECHAGTVDFGRAGAVKALNPKNIKAAGKLWQTFKSVLSSGRKAPKEVIIDSSAIFRFKDAEKLLKAGEVPITTKVAASEIRNVVGRNQVKGKGMRFVPKILESLKKVDDIGSPDLRISIRELITGRKGVAKGSLFGDGTIGATAIESGKTLITADKKMAAAVRKLGGDVRLLE